MSYEPVTIREAAQLEVLLFVGLAFVGSLAIIYWGFQTYRFGRIISDTPPEPVRSVAMGRTEVNGQIVPNARIYDQPFTEGQCVYCEYTVREYKEYPNDDDKDDHWETVDSGTLGSSFYIDDGTGRILVEPNDDTIYEVSSEYSNTIRVGRRESAPSTVQEFLTGGSGYSATSRENSSTNLLGRLRRKVFGGSSKTSSVERRPDGGVEKEETATPEETAPLGDADSQFEYVTRGQIGSVSSTSRKRQYIQRVLPLDEETYVYGGAERRDPSKVDDGDVVEVIRTDPSTGEFIVSDKSEFDLARGYTKRSVVYMVSGLLSSAMILALLAQILLTGPVYGIEAALP